eukprot:jgi/Botrbrau1/18424/Bobra.0072s0016.1
MMLTLLVSMRYPRRSVSTACLLPGNPCEVLPPALLFRRSIYPLNGKDKGQVVDSLARPIDGIREIRTSESRLIKSGSPGIILQQHFFFSFLFQIGQEL